MKKNLLLLTAFAVVTVIALTSSSPEESTGQEQFAFQPPIPEKFTVQKLDKPTEQGETVILNVQYMKEKLPPVFTLYNTAKEGGNLILRDDGNFPDKKAGDFIYSTLIDENIEVFTKSIKKFQETIKRQGNVNYFVGHDGKTANAEEITPFDFDRFNGGEEVVIDARLLNASQCGNSIQKEKSLFITDLSVVEDPARTYNFQTQSGNITGAWTFGTLMGNIINNQTTGISENAFLKSWVKSFLYNRTVNGQTSKIRKGVIWQLIVPWLKLCGVNATALDTDVSSVDPSDATKRTIETTWENYWNGISGTVLLQNAPFKLTAIVNRIDLRDNLAYAINVHNAGETRFVFTLLNVNDYSTLPTHTNISSGGIIGDDWKGMNVIFEYGNPQTTVTDLQGFANDWLDLSDQSYTLGDAYYLAALQAITDKVTNPNNAPNKPNGSCINRIRTNERIFDDPTLPGQTQAPWGDMNWEFRQFELTNPVDTLSMIPTTNEPLTAFDLKGLNSNLDPNSITTSNSIFDQNGSDMFIGNWILNNKNRILSSNYRIPQQYLAPVSENSFKILDYFALDVNSTQFSLYPISAKDIKGIRHQISLNTCRGCHGGETKTAFTMVAPTVYGEEAVYWDKNQTTTKPSGKYITFDNRFYFSTNGTAFGNLGATYESYLNNGYNVSINYDIQGYIQHTTAPVNGFIQNISPFLTGRRYTSTWNNQWVDDENDPSQEINPPPPHLPIDDQSLTGLFYVNDPDNKSNVPASAASDGPFPLNHDNKFAYNDLERRSMDLCSFLQSPSNPRTFNVISFLIQMPMAE